MCWLAAPDAWPGSAWPGTAARGQGIAWPGTAWPGIAARGQGIARATLRWGCCLGLLHSLDTPAVAGLQPCAEPCLGIVIIILLHGAGARVSRQCREGVAAVSRRWPAGIAWWRRDTACPFHGGGISRKVLHGARREGIQRRALSRQSLYRHREKITIT